MSAELEQRVEALERRFEVLSGSLQGLALLMASRVSSYRAFDEPVPHGLSTWHGTWEITCARYLLEQLDAFLPANPSTPMAEGLAAIREVLDAAIHEASEPNDRARREAWD